MSALELFHVLFGWIYFVGWCACYWPQVKLNHERKTTRGLSPDFVALNLLGFISYTIYTLAYLLDESAIRSYKKHAGYAPQVEVNDAFFAAHGFLVSTWIALQCVTMPPRTAPKKYTSAGVLTVVSMIALGFVGILTGRVEWYSYARFNGGVKVVSSIIKHIPQVVSNLRRSSTVGYSITLVLLDLVGCVFSLLQQALRCVMEGNLTGYTGNMAKTTLALEALLFDCYFMVQHFCHYPDHTDVDVLEMKLEAEGETETERDGEDGDGGSERARLVAESSTTRGARAPPVP